MQKEIMDEAYACPMCIKDIVLALGISKMFLLKLQTPTDELIRVNGHLYQIGQLVPFRDDSDRKILGLNGMNSCGHFVGKNAIDQFMPRYYLPA